MLGIYSRHDFQSWESSVKLVDKHSLAISFISVQIYCVTSADRTEELEWVESFEDIVCSGLVHHPLFVQLRMVHILCHQVHILINTHFLDFSLKIYIIIITIP